MPSSPPANMRPRLGRIRYLNVLPVYHALESGIISHGYELVYGPPAALNDMMAQGMLAAASTSCIEYARRPDRYYLLHDLAIGSNGPVQSVLLLSRLPIEQLDGKTILVSAETHTSAALLRLIIRERYDFSPVWQTGVLSEALAADSSPDAVLAIGDEALRLRGSSDFPYSLDLGDAWMQWTGLPFIFGVWVADRAVVDGHGLTEHPGLLLHRSLSWGQEHMPTILDIAAGQNSGMSREALAIYFAGLCYSLGKQEQEGMQLFWEKLASAGEISAPPPMRFLE